VRIDRIVLKNFKSIRDYDTGDLPDGIIGITGGNGQGKSTLLTAIAYALYGPESLSTGRADAVTWGEEKAEVSLYFTADSSQHVLTRTQDSKGTSKAKLWDMESGNQIASGPNVVNDTIERLIGIDLVGFQASVFSKQDDILGIGSLQPAKRASTILRLLGIEQIDKGIKSINDHSKQLKGELDMYQRAIDSMPQVDIEAVQKQISILNEKIPELLDRLNHSISLRDEAQSERDTLAEQYKRFVDHQSKVERIKAQLYTAEKAYALAKADAASDKPEPPVKPDHWVDPDEYRDRTKEYSYRKSELDKAKKSSVCPTCGRPFDGTDESHLVDEENKLVAMMDELTADSRYAFEASQYQEALRNYESVQLPNWEGARARLAQAESTKAELDKDLVNLTSGQTVEDCSESYTVATNNYNAIVKDVQEIENKVEVAQAELRSYVRELEAYEKIRATNEEHVKESNRLQKEVVVYTTTSAELTKFKTSMTAGILPALSDRASSLIGQITDGKYSEVSLTPQYDIQYRNDLGDLKAFPNLSGGEQDAFALAMRLAIADLRAGRIGILVLDEIFESLDPDRQEATWQSLEKMSGRYSQIFLVTHVASFKDRAPYTIMM
jgi:DNA repair exonuclease SbcCD ATPase subunit